MTTGRFHCGRTWASPRPCLGAVQHPAWRSEWIDRIANGAMIGSGFSEVGDTALGSYSKRLVPAPEGDDLLLNGSKFYTTGSYHADYINLGAAGADGAPIAALIPTKAPGVEILDDWDGFGQALTASGTVHFKDVRIAPSLLKPVTRIPYSSGFFQLVHMASLAGIGRAAAEDVARLVAERKRVYGHGNASRSSADPQVLQVVGKVASAAYVATAVVLRAAAALQRSHDAWQEDSEAEQADANAAAHIEVSQSVTIVSSLILDATTVLFDALGASAAKSSTGLDRYWRNARTISSHNPRIYHDRVVGDFVVNRKRPASKSIPYRAKNEVRAVHARDSAPRGRSFAATYARTGQFSDVANEVLKIAIDASGGHCSPALQATSSEPPPGCSFTASARLST